MKKINLKNIKSEIFLTAGVLLLAIVVYFIGKYFINRNIPPDDVVIAKIGNDVITVKDFRLNYEFGLPDLKLGNSVTDMKRSYLNFMINERLLAQQGYKLGLDTSANIRELRQEFLSEEMIKAIIKYEVEDKITVSQDEIKDAVNKSSVSFDVNFWPVSNFENAERVRAIMMHEGFTKTINTIIQSQHEIKLDTSKFQTGYKTWLDIDPKVLNIVKDLPHGQISQPVLLDGVYYLFQVKDIRRSAVMPDDYLKKSSTMRKIIYNTKLKEGTAKLIDSFMTPKNVVTKGFFFITLSNALAEWKSEKIGDVLSFRDAVRSGNDKYPSMNKLKQYLNQTITSYKDGQLTVNQLLDLLDVSPVKADPKDEYTFRNQLNTQIGVTVRNYLLAKEGMNRKYEDLPWVQKELNDWMNKWVFEETRHFYTDKVNLTEEDVQKYFLSHISKYKTDKNDKPVMNRFIKEKVCRDAGIYIDQTVLKAKVDSLKKCFPIEINYTVLDTLNVHQPKNRWSFLQVFQGGTDRLAVPIVDPAWGL
jgi:hypothetical protein